MSKELVDLVQNLGQPRVLVVGDAMLDRYVWGDAERISQEAPVILLRADRREERLGGASSVATMLRALGAKVMLAGIVGNDHDGGRIRQMLTDLGIDHEAVITDIAPAQHRQGTLRRPGPAPPSAADDPRRLRGSPGHQRADPRADHDSSIQNQLKKTDIVLISDYDKGVCTPSLLSAVISAARARGIKVVADPIRGHDYRKYHGCSAITPNRLEAGLATGRTLNDMSEVWHAAANLQEKLDLEAAIITLDKDGMAIKHRDGRAKHFPTRPRQVYDITGAGDMVMSVLGLALASGADYEQAIQLANVAGGLEVEKIGVATVTRDEILRDLMRRATPRCRPTRCSRWKRSCRSSTIAAGSASAVVFTNGCFDVLHAGHVQYLQEAALQGDVLVVGLNSDASVRALKGKTRPVQPLAARSLILAGLQAVDFVTVFDEATPMHLIQAIRPDVLVKGADYSKDEVVGAQFVESYGGRVHLALLHHGHSTTNIIERMRAA